MSLSSGLCNLVTSGLPILTTDIGDVSAPSEAWRFLPGGSPGRVRISPPPVLSVASVAEPVADW
jgi:hypothetical protein